MAKLEDGQVNIHGKTYSTVAYRVNQFRTEHMDNYSIVTEIISADESTVIMKASIYRVIIDKEAVLVATGHAEEQRSASTINKTSALENCETSAIGRALAAFGLAGTEFASADEVAQAISQQNGSTSYTKPTGQLQGMATDKQRETIAKHLRALGIANEDQSGYLIEQFGVELPLSKQVASEVIDALFAEDQSV